MIFFSDPQIWWKEPEVTAYWDPTIWKNMSPGKFGRETNINHVNSMNKFKSEFGKQLAGTIINGDLTASGHPDELLNYLEF